MTSLVSPKLLKFILRGTWMSSNLLKTTNGNLMVALEEKSADDQSPPKDSSSWNREYLNKTFLAMHQIVVELISLGQSGGQSIAIPKAMPLA